ncbi:MAG TPA: Ig-like domain-containing protein, partial [Acidimicrobiia bacterium]|nr:Ig-like domain-containing protein [Acidimicrobiia bacterium]
AINQIRQLGIAQGTSATTFNPYGSVARWEMALFLTRLLTVVGVGLPSGVTQGFTDIGSFDLATQTAINQIRQLGITAGTSATTYSPFLALPRWQMALFLARTLETGGAIPFRVSLALSSSATPSGSTVVLTITVREPDGSAAGGRRVDVFVAAGFDSSGRCFLDTDASINSGDAGTGTNCVIDNSDPQTNNSGVATVNLTHNAVTEIDTIYVWLGESGETFDLQDVRGEASVQLTWGTAPTGLNLPTSVNAVFGTTASVKAQLTGAGGAAVPLSGQSIRFIVRRGGNTILTQSINTGADGSATLAYVGPVDPSAGDDPAVTDTVTAFWDRDGDNTDDGAAEFDDTGTVIWDEQLAPMTSAILGQDEVSTLVGTFANFTITVRDRFGQPVAGAAVTFRSASGDSAPIATNASGVASFGYTVTAGGAPTGLADAVDARVDLNGDGDFTDPGDLGFGGVVDVVHYWVVTAPDLAGNTQFDLLAVNGGNNTIDVKEIGNPNYYRLTYDSDGDTFETNGNSRNLGQFESDLSNLTLPDLDGGGNTALRTDPYSASPSGSSVFRLTTN